MFILKDKIRSPVKPYQWFAWYPVWAWKKVDDVKSVYILGLAWLQKIWVTSGHTQKHRYWMDYPKEQYETDH